MRSFGSSELQWRIEGHFGSSGGGDTGAYDMFLGQDYHTLAQGSEQRVLPEKVTQWFVVLLRKMRAKDRGATQFSLIFLATLWCPGLSILHIKAYTNKVRTIKEVQIRMSVWFYEQLHAGNKTKKDN